MNRKFFSTVLCGAMILSVTSFGSIAKADTTSLRLVNGKIEVDAALKDLAAAYEEETGVHVEIESMGGGIDIQGTLKGYIKLLLFLLDDVYYPRDYHGIFHFAFYVIGSGLLNLH